MTEAILVSIYVFVLAIFVGFEVITKVPPLLKKGRYFPNGDHGIQPMATFAGMCRFMTLLHEVCNNPEGEFPRV